MADVLVSTTGVYAASSMEWGGLLGTDIPLTTLPLLPLNGTHYTAAVLLPASLPNGAQVGLTVLQSDADRINAAITFDYALEWEVSPGTWRHIAGGSWVGIDATDADTGLPYRPHCAAGLTTGVADGQGGRMPRSKKNWLCRGRITLPTTRTVGALMDVRARAAP